MEAVSNEVSETEIPASKIISLNGSTSTYYYRDTTHGTDEDLTIIGKIPGVVKITAFIKDNEHVTDTITVVVKDTLLTAYKINAPKTALSIGEKISLSTTAYPSEIKVDALYYSENEDVVEVSKNGHVTALKGGEAIVCAKSLYDSSIIAKLKITVIEPVLQKMEVKSTTPSVLLGRTYDLGLTFVPGRPSNELMIKLSDEEVISVDENGIVTALKPGTCKVTFTCAGKQVSADVTVLGDFETGLTCDEQVADEFAMSKGESFDISYEILPETASQLAKVEISDETVLSAVVVNNKVTLKAIGVGTTTVYVKSPMSTFIKSYVVTVDYAVATAIKATPATVNIKLEGEKEVKLNVEPLGAKQEIKYEITSGEEFFTVELIEEAGAIKLVVKAVAVGEGKITVKTTDETVTLEITVKVTE